MCTALDLPVRLLLNRVDTTMRNAMEGKACIIDFWHSNCSRCPAALEKANRVALKFTNISFLSCALSQGESNFEITAELVQE